MSDFNPLTSPVLIARNLLSPGSLATPEDLNDVEDQLPVGLFNLPNELLIPVFHELGTHLTHREIRSALEAGMPTDDGDGDRPWTASQRSFADSRLWFGNTFRDTKAQPVFFPFTATLLSRIMSVPPENLLQHLITDPHAASSSLKNSEYNSRSIALTDDYRADPALRRLITALLDLKTGDSQVLPNLQKVFIFGSKASNQQYTEARTSPHRLRLTGPIDWTSLTGDPLEFHYIPPVDCSVAWLDDLPTEKLTIHTRSAHLPKFQNGYPFPAGKSIVHCYPPEPDTSVRGRDLEDYLRDMNSFGQGMVTDKDSVKGSSFVLHLPRSARADAVFWKELESKMDTTRKRFKRKGFNFEVWDVDGGH
ncbi:uncharacterized protein MKK02DRAFT_41374 [Dioszegia hungarica]|uniref:Uncharacterized protein n=1 Tax=Dioszegia hungarica TaxID=4972 RepID=A0AA38H132_9TREE|nr:uncharacterized protein MKK02DRAFT_41374 [Dioszegia hungarica]KAI9631746.1 hypothetical protein MKK02DRAFT_41374 [Dioszegia hungarica]